MKSSLKRRIIVISSIIVLGIIVFLYVVFQPTDIDNENKLFKTSNTEFTETITTSNDVINNDSVYPINSNGKTYGSAMNVVDNNFPDLIAVKGENGVEGYIHKDDFLRLTVQNYEHYQISITDESTIKWLRSQYKETRSDYDTLSFYYDMYDIPVYDVDGEKIVDIYAMSNGAYIIE